jgi:hypothetical protein
VDGKAALEFANKGGWIVEIRLGWGKDFEAKFGVGRGTESTGVGMTIATATQGVSSDEGLCLKNAERHERVSKSGIGENFRRWQIADAGTRADDSGVIYGKGFRV